MKRLIFIRLRAENHGCKPVDECEQTALRRMSLDSVKGGPAEAKRRRVNKGTTPVKAWGSILTMFFLSLSIALAETDAFLRQGFGGLSAEAKSESFLAKADDWQITKSTHFIVYYKNAQEDFLGHLIERAEDYYNKIADDLGFRRYDFWLWDNRAKIYIYDNAQDYQAATGQPSWSSGCAKVKEKVISTFLYAQRFFDTILPHEMGHIIFREFVGFDNYAIPLWLEEGVSSYQENLMRLKVNKLVKEAIDKGTFMSLEKLSNFNPQLSQDSELVKLFYVESLSIINYLIKEFGSDNFVFFCQNLRDKKNLEAALRSAYSFSNIQELEQAWRKFLKE